MILNDTRYDVKVLLAREDMQQIALAEKLGTSKQYVNRIINQDFIVSKPFVALLEAIGYDIKIEYVKKAE